ncbi:MAG: ABC transporter ATP-binding protein, partial [Thermomicrobiales bacterium]|nr:ABC transporter ATP-binding protein [Thermomicrobiales bacterium]
MATVQLDHIRVDYDGKTVVHDVSFSVDDGEFAVLVGPSGSGKSTILRTITGYAPIDAGTVRIDGKDVTYAPVRERDIAMVFQNLALYPHLTVRQNWEFPLKAAKLPKAEQAKRVDDVARMLEMTPYLHRYPHQLSGGQKQRVAMGRALVRNPQLFLLDEPLGALDAKLRVEARSAFKTLQRDLGITTIYVTHDQIEAQALGTKIIVLNDGIVQQVGTPETIYDNPSNQFVAGLFGSPPMNLIDVDVSRDQGVLIAHRAEFSIALPPHLDIEGLGSGASTGAVLGVRPESLRLQARPGEDSIAATVFVVEP